jgi:TRAP transporter 4TM/12TM fusion protein
MREFKGIGYYIISGIGLFLCFFQLYTAYVGPFSPMIQRGLFMGLGFLILFLLIPGHKGAPKDKLPIVDLIMAILSMVIVIYGMVNFTEPDFVRIGSPNTLDNIFGTLLILLTLEGTRRTGGLPLCLVAAGSIGYFFLGPWLPGMLKFPKIEAYNLIITNFMTLGGILGTVMGAAANVIFMFILFGALLHEFGGGDFFIRLATTLLGSVKGGPAKVAIIASGFMGMISGIGPLVVMATGVFTIPLMRKAGYSPQYAAAVEATAASGGQIMPPVMGIAAFVMADMLGISYLQVCIAALLPAILYYLAVFFMVHLEALKIGIERQPKEKQVKVSDIIKQGWKFVIPVLVLVIWIGYFEAGAALSAFYANITLIVLCVFEEMRSKHKLELKKIFLSFEKGVKQMLSIIATVGAVGIIIGVINLSGLGIKLSTILINFSYGILPILLFLTMLASILLGMGMPTVACYTILAVLAAPAIIKLGVIPIAAHLFVFYFGMLSAITPPVALSVIAAISIAESPFWKTGWTSIKLAISGFLIPFIFVYQPVLLLKGNMGEIVLTVVTSVTGIFVLSIAVSDYFTRKLYIIERLPLFIGAILLIYPGWRTDIIGFIIALCCLSPQLIQLMNEKKILKKVFAFYRLL